MPNPNPSLYTSWWFCENILCHPDQIALLHMGFPRVLVLVRDYSKLYPCTFEQFRQSIAELNFLSPQDRQQADIPAILTDAWNFLALVERKEEDLYDEFTDYPDPF